MPEVNREEGLISVTRTLPGSKETSSEERIKIRPFVTDTARVTVKGGATVNMGNYESARVDISLSLPCYVEEVEEVYAFCLKFVDDRVKEEYTELKGAIL